MSNDRPPGDAPANGNAPVLGMRVQSVRFSESQWAVLQEESRMQGISTSQYIREAAIARYWIDVVTNERPAAESVQEFLRAAQATERPSHD